MTHPPRLITHLIAPSDTRMAAAQAVTAPALVVASVGPIDAAVESQTESLAEVVSHALSWGYGVKRCSRVIAEYALDRLRVVLAPKQFASGSSRSGAAAAAGSDSTADATGYVPRPKSMSAAAAAAAAHTAMVPGFAELQAFDAGSFNQISSSSALAPLSVHSAVSTSSAPTTGGDVKAKKPAGAQEKEISEVNRLSPVYSMCAVCIRDPITGELVERVLTGTREVIQCWNLSAGARSGPAHTLERTFEGHTGSVLTLLPLTLPLASAIATHVTAKGSDDADVNDADADGADDPHGTIHTHFASGSEDGTVKVWPLALPYAVASAQAKSLTRPPVPIVQCAFTLNDATQSDGFGVTSLAAVPHARLLAGQTDVVLYDCVTRQTLARFEGHTRAVTSLAVHPTPDCLAFRLWSGSADSTMRSWKWNTPSASASGGSAGNSGSVSLSAVSCYPLRDKVSALIIVAVAELPILAAAVGNDVLLLRESNTPTKSTPAAPAAAASTVATAATTTMTTLAVMRGHANTVRTIMRLSDARLITVGLDRSLREWNILGCAFPEAPVTAPKELSPVSSHGGLSAQVCCLVSIDVDTLRKQRPQSTVLPAAAASAASAADDGDHKVPAAAYQAALAAAAAKAGSAGAPAAAASASADAASGTQTVLVGGGMFPSVTFAVGTSGRPPGAPGTRAIGKFFT